MKPKPDGPIPVWLGAFGPCALAVTAGLADGWIPSLGSMPTGEIPAVQRRIDAAAEAVGRRPGEIRGILKREHPHRSRCRAVATRSPVRPSTR
jgi:alkanesulfonate monooxygenase SsuD/methylene tetrahydromethanopterin reductase-like flavin-dependent oxidoreductase (luciferase family)